MELKDKRVKELLEEASDCNRVARTALTENTMEEYKRLNIKVVEVEQELLTRYRNLQDKLDKIRETNSFIFVG